MELSYDYVILGAGPAGLQLGYFLARAGRSYVILEAQDAPGTFFRTFPRHRRLLSINKVHTGCQDPETNLRWDWNSLLGDADGPLFKEFSRDYFPDAAALPRYLAAYAQRYALNVRYHTRIGRVSRAAEFMLYDQDGQRYRARRLVVATGASQPYVPPIPGIELAETYATMPTDPDDFLDQRVLILGAGNSGFETANHLTATAARIHIVALAPPPMAWQTHFPGHLRAVNLAYMDTFQLKSQNAVVGGRIERIERADGEYVVTMTSLQDATDTGQLTYDRVLVCTGFRFDCSIFDASCRPALMLNDRFPRLTSAWESTAVEGLYFAGVLMLGRDIKKASSSFIHGFRYNIHALHRILECRYEGACWPSRIVPASPDAVADLLLERINRTSALWQQFGFLGDVLVLDEHHGGARHYEELPVDYVAEAALFRDRRYLTLTLEYGDRRPVSIFRPQPLPNTTPNYFLHPVVRCYTGSEQTTELHLPDSLLGEWWDADLHRRPLLELLTAWRDRAMATA